MKLQNLLSSSKSSDVHCYVNKIVNIQKQIDTLLGSRKTWEQNLAGVLIELIVREEKYPTYERIPELKMLKENEESGKMIVNICTRIDADLNIAFKTSDYAAGDSEIEA